MKRLSILVLPVFLGFALLRISDTPSSPSIPARAIQLEEFGPVMMSRVEAPGAVAAPDSIVPRCPKAEEWAHTLLTGDFPSIPEGEILSSNDLAEWVRLLGIDLPTALRKAREERKE